MARKEGFPRVAEVLDAVSVAEKQHEVSAPRIVEFLVANLREQRLQHLVVLLHHTRTKNR